MTDSETKQQPTATKKCSRCHCVYALRFYSNNPKTDIPYKICDTCREKAKARPLAECPTEGCAHKCRQRHLKAHIKSVHDKIKDIECPHDDCDFKCSENGDLKKHIKAVHDKIKDIECPYENCDYKCSEKGMLKRHIKGFHNKIKDIECPYENCDYKCSSNGNLKNHIKVVHDKIQDCECPHDDCDFKSSQNRDLKTHIKAIHDKIRDFVCPNNNCGYASSYNCHLKSHLETCGDSMTRPEREVADALEMMEINYENEKRFDDCKDKNTLPFDFYVPDLDCLIEFDGIHHFKPIRGQEKLESTQRHDTIKTQFCIDTQRYLLRIPYDHTETIKDLVYGFIHRLCADKFH